MSQLRGLAVLLVEASAARDAGGPGPLDLGPEGRRGTRAPRHRPEGCRGTRAPRPQPRGTKGWDMTGRKVRGAAQAGSTHTGAPALSGV